MVSIREEARLMGIRLFKWNDKLSKNALPKHHGLFLLSITNKFTTSGTLGCDLNHRHGSSHGEDLFNLAGLVSRPSIEAIVSHALSNSRQFLPETEQYLRAEITEYICRSFRFTLDTLLCKNAPVVALTVDIYRTRKVSYAPSHLVNDGYTLPPFFPPKISIPDEDFQVIDCKPELRNTMFAIRNALGLRVFGPIEPVAVDEPVGLVQVLALDNVTELRDDKGSVDTCPICLERFSIGSEVTTTSCSHVFHSNCIGRWIWKKQSCPMCRSVLH